MSQGKDVNHVDTYGLFLTLKSGIISLIIKLLKKIKMNRIAYTIPYTFLDDYITISLFVVDAFSRPYKKNQWYTTEYH